MLRRNSKQVCGQICVQQGGSQHQAKGQSYTSKHKGQSKFHTLINRTERDGMREIALREMRPVDDSAKKEGAVTSSLRTSNVQGENATG